MYPLTRMIFVLIYVSIAIFSIILGLKSGSGQAPSFFVVMMTITLLVDRRIKSIFVIPSTTLALTYARALDNETEVSRIILISFVKVPFMFSLILNS